MDSFFVFLFFFFNKKHNKEFVVWNFSQLHVLQVPLPHKPNKCADPVAAGASGPSLPSSCKSYQQAPIPGRLLILGRAPSLCLSWVGSPAHLPVVSLGTKGEVFMVTSLNPRGILAGRPGILKTLQ